MNRYLMTALLKSTKTSEMGHPAEELQTRVTAPDENTARREAIHRAMFSGLRVLKLTVNEVRKVS